MNLPLLKSWLELPEGPWPPEPHVLLALPPSADAAEAERRALKLMSRLRPHQLLHPELVTEGMNRLAQAMLAFARTAPPEPVFRAAPEPSPTRFPEPTAAEVVDFAPVVLPVAPEPLLAEVPATPTIFDAEVVELLPAPVARARFLPFAYVQEHGFVEPRATVPIPAPERRDAPFGPPSANRRDEYRRLRRLRRLEVAWNALGPFAGAPEEAALTPGRVFAVREAHESFLTAWKALDIDSDLLREVSPTTIALFEQSTACEILRMMDARQRSRLAADWAEGVAELEAECEARRFQLRRTRPHVRLTRQIITAIGLMVRSPELLLGLLAIAIVLSAWFRSWER